MFYPLEGHGRFLMVQTIGLDRGFWWHIWAMAAILFCASMLSARLQAQEADGALLIEIEGPIGPAVEDHVARGFEQANAAAAPLIILRIDTPGGLACSTRGLVKTILASQRSVACYVSPSGARAASAGAYILLACHIAVMAPGTNVGSATPIMIGGTPGSTEPETEKSDHPDLTDKVINDSKAYMRSLAEIRGRPGDVAEKFVSEALNLTALEAKELGLIDMIAVSIRDMLGQLNGRVVSIDGQQTELDTDLLDVTLFERTWRDELLAFITNPNTAYLLLMAGIYGLFIEATNPGLLAPGILGGVCLILGLYALQMLPINYAGVALIVLGLALMTTETFVPAFGILGIGGIISFLLGSIMLIDSDVPEFTISPILIGTVSATTAGLFLFVLSFAVRAWRQPAVSGNAAMLGSTARILRWQSGAGAVKTHGEVWSAVGIDDAKPGDSVKIMGIDGLTVTVSPLKTTDNKEKDDAI